MVRKKKALDDAWQKAEKEYRHISVEQLAKLAKSGQSNKRLLSLCLMLKQIEQGNTVAEYFELARSLVEYSDSNCRWQSLIVIGEAIESKPDDVWEVVSEFGDSEDSDMRSAIATILLEHLLNYNFDRYFPKVQEEIRRGRLRFIDTLDMCGFDRMSGPNYLKTQRFLTKAKRGNSSSEWTV